MYLCDNKANIIGETKTIYLMMFLSIWSHTYRNRVHNGKVYFTLMSVNVSFDSSAAIWDQ